MKAVIDTNILVDYLRGIESAEVELALYSSPLISLISWIEVMAGATEESEAGIRAFLQSFEVLAIDSSIAERTVVLRKSKRVKLPDAIIWATAQVNDCLLVSRNSRDFDPHDPGVRIPYTI